MKIWYLFWTHLFGFRFYGVDMFELHKGLKDNLVFVGELGLSSLLLMPDSSVPWVVLVPQRNGIREWHELLMEDQKTLLLEMNKVSLVFSELFKPDKLNIGALGNIVEQFHLHIICRYKNDKAWPAPMWGQPADKDQDVIDKRVETLRLKLF